MGVSMGKTGDSNLSEINMTPMIDVLLVLLVIFIIVQMNMQRTFDVQLPVDNKDQEVNPNNNTIIMEIEPNGVVKVNTRQLQPAQVEPFLKEIYTNRPDKVIFIKASPDVPYGDVINYIDIARAAGVAVVGAVLTPTLAPVSSTP
ncbi:MAG: biopolymer transporter ExbD [Gemmatimonadota bacterium]